MRETILPEHMLHDLTYLKEISYQKKSLSYTLFCFSVLGCNMGLPGSSAVVYVCYVSLGYIITALIFLLITWTLWDLLAC